jgi:hypothetical protein
LGCHTLGFAFCARLVRTVWVVAVLDEMLSRLDEFGLPGAVSIPQACSLFRVLLPDLRDNFMTLDGIGYNSPKRSKNLYRNRPSQLHLCGPDYSMNFALLEQHALTIVEWLRYRFNSNGKYVPARQMFPRAKRTR